VLHLKRDKLTKAAPRPRTVGNSGSRNSTATPNATHSISALKKLGWRVMVIWECETTPTKLRKILERRTIWLTDYSIIAEQR
jgi:hypothetical protein